MAGDSQTTWDTGKMWAANKITDLKHPFGNALIAEAGAVLTSSNIVDELQTVAKDKELLNARGLPGVCELAVRKVRERLRHAYSDCSSEELQNLITSEEMDSMLMIANYEAGDTPQIRTISLRHGIAERAARGFAVIGSGSDLASYLLGNLLETKKFLAARAVAMGRRAIDHELGTDEATMIAAFILEEVKKHDQYCGGPTKIGVLRHPKTIATGKHLVIKDNEGNVLKNDSLPIFIVPQKEVDKITKNISTSYETMRIGLWTDIAEHMTEAAKQWTKQYEKVIMALEKKIKEQRAPKRAEQ